MIEGALTVSEMQVRDIMVPRAQMDVIDINEPLEKFIPQVIATAHSRFPVIDENRDDVIGILLAKDLLRYYAGEEEFNVREMLRPAVFVPESEAPERAAARVPREPQPHGDRRRRVRRRRGAGDDRGRARADRRRHRGRVRLRRGSGQHPARARRPLPREGAHPDRGLQRSSSAPSFPDEAADTVGGLVISTSAGCRSAASRS